MPEQDILHYLGRQDKWYLGGGSSLLWAPIHPQWLDVLGFWDGAHFLADEFQPVFTITFLDEKERALVPKFRSRQWNPAFLTQQYQIGGKVDITEKKALLSADALVSEVTFKNNSTVPRMLHLVMWSGQPTSAQGDRGEAEVMSDGKTITIVRDVQSGNGRSTRLACSLGMTGRVSSYSINTSQTIPNVPCWEYTPFYEKFRDGRLPGEERIAAPVEGGICYLALHSTLTLNPHARKTITCAAAIGQDRKRTLAALQKTLQEKRPIQASLRSWRSFFDRVPSVECSDRYIQKYYWYQWYGLKLNMVEEKAAGTILPAVCEGPGRYHRPLLRSCPAHVRETRWMNSSELAQGCFLTVLQHQREDGGFPDVILSNSISKGESGLLNWGESVLALHAIHPDTAFLGRVYHSLARYAGYTDRTWDRDRSGLSDAEAAPDGGLARRKGVEASVTAYGLKRDLAEMARQLGRTEEADNWGAEADKVKRAILEMMWDPEDELFYDVDSSTRERIRVKTVACFYPFMTDIVDERHVPGLKRHLLNPQEFWTPYPLATVSRDAPDFSAEGEEKGVRQHRPWNGRARPEANCCMIEALASVACRIDPTLKPYVVELITAFFHMVFMGDDVRFPNSYEHYHPISGKPSLYRGLNDVQRSWMVDLILKYVAGIRPRLDGTLAIDPFPFAIRRIAVDRIPFRGHLLRVEIEDEAISLYVDGQLRSSGKRGESLEFRLGSP